jgi:hypothetical protein
VNNVIEILRICIKLLTNIAIDSIQGGNIGNEDGSFLSLNAANIKGVK